MRKLHLLIMVISGVVLFSCLPVAPVSYTRPTPTPHSSSKQVVKASFPLVERWRWSSIVPGLEFPSLISVTDEFVISGSYDGRDRKVVVFDVSSGKPVWESSYIRHLASLSTLNDSLYVGAITYVQAFDLETGQIEWQGVKQPQDKRGFLYVYPTDEHLQVYDYETNRLYFVDPQTGSTLDEVSYPHIFLKKGDLYYTGCGRGYQTSCLNAFTVVSEQLLWSQRFKGAIYLWPVFIEDKVMIINAGGKIYAINVKTGDIMWETVGLGFITSPTLQNNLIYAIRSDAAIVALNAGTGEEAGIVEVMPNSTIDSDGGYTVHYAIAASDKFVAAYYGNSRELIVFEKIDN